MGVDEPELMNSPAPMQVVDKLHRELQRLDNLLEVQQ